MVADWTSLCRSRGFVVDGTHVVVDCGPRSHRVSVTDGVEAYDLRAIVVRQGVVRKHDNLSITVWLRNRATALVGFRVDEGGRLVAEAWVPKAGLTASEFQLYLRAVAQESDRFEYQLTGEDVE